jgi:hypothetical protein
MTPARIKDFTAYPDNPFSVPDIVQKTHVRKSRTDQFTNKSTGEVFDLLTQAKEYVDYHDSGRYIKLFHGSIGVVADLGIRGVALLCYVMANLKPGVSVIELPRKVITADPRYSTLRGGGYYVGITDLLSHGIIARVASASECYYINANILFNGDRKKLVKEKV